ncbi:DMT family transporter [Microbacterium sp. LBN7]|uniref:DMT family transporter n=1 Tax=Microbacterium sp. LBN7 TaxID=3129773 RepID=UPI0032549DDD
MTAAARPWVPVIAVVVSVVLWSTTYGLSAIVLVTASPAVLSELRLVLAVPLMLGLVILLRPRLGLPAVTRALRRPATVVLALTGVALFYLPSNLGLVLSTAGTASLMSASLPVLTALIAWWLIRERITARVLAGLAITTAGIVVASAGAVEFGPGALLLVLGLASYALYTVLLRRSGVPASDRAPVPAEPPTDAVVLATATAIWGALLLLPWFAWEVANGSAAWPSDGPGWVSILFLSLIVTGPTMALYNYGAERVPSAVAGTATGAVPALGYAFAVALGEPPEPIKVVGGTLAFLGILLAALPAPSDRPGRAVSERMPVGFADPRGEAAPQREGAVT